MRGFPPQSSLSLAWPNRARGFPQGIDLRSGLVGWWKLDEGTGATAYDSSGSGGTGTLNGSPTWAAGLFGKSPLFAGSQYVSVPNSTAINGLASFTVAAWVKLAALPAAGDVATFFDAADAADVGYELMLYNAGAAYDFELVLGDTGGTHAVGIQYAWTPTLNTWYHVAATFGSQAYAMYLSGVSVKSGTWAYSLGSPSTSNYIGKSNSYTESSNFYESNLHLYKRVLTSAELLVLANSGVYY